MLISLAGLTVEILPRYPELTALCRDYAAAPGATPDFSVSVTEEEIRAEGTPGDGLTPGYLETLAVYRKLCERALDRGRLLLHGSAFAYRGEGVLFTAPSGTGKSTHARLWREVYGDRVTVINDDILKVDINRLVEEKNGGRPIKVVANLPYYITTPIIMGLFESHVPLESITVMVQKEVADRMQVGPGTKDYGALSLAVQYYAEPYIVANVPPNCFMPRPAVGSAVIRLTRHQKPPVEVMDEKLMFRLIRASFNQRRKTLANGLKNSGELNLSKEVITAAIEKLGKGSSVRGEALDLEEFARLTNIIKEEMEHEV